MHSPGNPCVDNRLDPRTAVAAGLLSTAAYALVLYLLLRQGMSAQPANLVALLLTAIGTAAYNRKITFGVRCVLSFSIGWSLTAASLWLLDTALAAPRQAVEITVLTIANLAATAVRFSLFQS